MKKALVPAALCLLVATAVSPALAAEIIVDVHGGGDYITISEGLAAAGTGDIVTVWPGLYAENVTIDKVVQLRSRDGSASTHVAGPDTLSDVVSVVIDNVSIEGFELSGGREGLAVDQFATLLNVSDLKIGETGQYHLSLPPGLVDQVVPEVELVSHASGMFNAVALLQGTVGASATWPLLPSGFVYFHKDSGSIQVHGPSSPVLTLQPGTIIKSNLYSNFSIHSGGALAAEGVVFTSHNDDSMGGDTNGDGPSTGSHGHWTYMAFWDGTNESATHLTDCQFLHGGRSNYKMVQLNGVSFPITNCTFSMSQGGGLLIDDATVPVTGCTFSEGEFAFSVEGTSTTELISGNTILGPKAYGDNYLLKTVADGMADLLANNIIIPREDGRYSRIGINSSTLSQSSTWPVLPEGMVYDVVRFGGGFSIRGEAFPVLTLQPGTIVKLYESSIFVRSGGALVAEGVVFTSARDDSVGGDSNGDGPSSMRNGEWHGVKFESASEGAACVLDSCHFRYGGNTSTMSPIHIEGVSFPVNRCTFEYGGQGGGLSLIDSEAAVSDCTFRNNVFSMAIEGTSSGLGVTGNIILPQADDNYSYVLHTGAGPLPGLVNNNTIIPRPDGRFGRIGVYESLITQSVTWPVLPAGVVLEIGGDITVEGSGWPTLTIPTGSVIKFHGYQGIELKFRGGLKANGVSFTSWRDDSAGGDSNGDFFDGVFQGQWDSILFFENSAPQNSFLTDCLFRAGGRSWLGMVVMLDVSVPVTNCTFDKSRYAGLYIQNAAPVVSGSTFSDNLCAMEIQGADLVNRVYGNTILGQWDLDGGYAIQASAKAVLPLLLLNTFEPRPDGVNARLGILESNLDYPAIWPVLPEGMVYELPEGRTMTVTGPSPASLTLQPGTVFKFGSNARLEVGFNGNLVADGAIFTSSRDDSAAGNTNGDEDTAPPVPGDWDRIQVSDGAGADLRNCEIRYGGQGGLGALSFATVTDSRVAYSSFQSNVTGLYAGLDARPHIVANCFTGNTEYGVYSDAPSDTRGRLPARDCWWGDASGPGGYGSGSGDAVSDHVLFEPWATDMRCEILPSPVPPVVVPERTTIFQAYPNPFNPRTTIAFEIPRQEEITLRVFDLSGRLVRNLIADEPRNPGRHEAVWNGRDDAGRQVASGTYFYHLDAGSFSETKRMVLVK